MPNLKNRVYGENSQPFIDEKTGQLVSDNNSPMAAIQSFTTYFQINALPGKPYQVELNQDGKKIQAEISFKEAAL
jgi:hypothetical protein